MAGRPGPGNAVSMDAESAPAGRVVLVVARRAVERMQHDAVRADIGAVADFHHAPASGGNGPDAGRGLRAGIVLAPFVAAVTAPLVAIVAETARRSIVCRSTRQAVSSKPDSHCRS